MDGCPACLVLTPAFTALALMMNGADAQAGDAMNIRAIAAEPAPDSDRAGEGPQVAQKSIERP